MRVIEGENELRLTCSRSASGGIALLRCETQDDIVRLPDEIDGVPVTEVGAYVLSERAPDLTGKDTFAVRITCGGTEPKHNAAAIRTVTLPKDAKSKEEDHPRNFLPSATVTLFSTPSTKASISVLPVDNTWTYRKTT